MKYVVITGGVVSGLGKGITSSSIGVLLRACGLQVTSIKIDPYLNTDAGTMSPYEHGEVYVLDDGGEVDLDLGNYERFLSSITLTRDHNITTGKIYQHVINRERRGDYLGKTVQLIPHVTDAIQDWIERVAALPVDGKIVPDVCLIELGGTVGDIESMIYLEALRQLQYRVGADNFCLVHVSLVPAVGLGGEQKSKPTQHGVKELRSTGLNPDLIVCRSAKPLERSVKAKIAHYAMCPADNCLSIYDVSNIYKVPLLMLEQRVPSLILGRLRINKMPPEDIPAWRVLATKIEAASTKVTIALVGKYTGLSDSYLSVTHSVRHAAIDANVLVDIEWIEASHLEVLGNQADKADVEKHTLAWKKLKSVQGILVPGGFGNRGIEGLILTANYARVHNIPYFGICLGLQTAVIEFARNVCGLTDAHSSEFDKNSSAPVVFEMPEISQTVMGGTMRLGARRTNLKAGTLAHQLYNEQNAISERHRHRYEVNGKYISTLEAAGLVFSGIDDKQERMEIVELPERSHPYYLAVQFHPEFMSRPLHPSPVFRGFIRAAAGLFVRGKNMSVCKRATSPPPSTSRGTSSGSTSDSTVEHKDDSSAPTATAIAATISTSTATPARGTTESADATSTKKHIADTPLPTPGPVFEPITQKRDW